MSAVYPFDELLAQISGAAANPDLYRSRGRYIPARMMIALRAYVDEGKRPGNFLQAVLSNDLAAAVASADSENLDNLPAFVDFVYNELPSAAWRSREKMEAWIAKFEPAPTEEELLNYDRQRLRAVMDGSLLRKMDDIAIARQIQSMRTAL
jgi:hypothetical protein